jgi:preprotein translocase subunit SecA
MVDDVVSAYVDGATETGYAEDWDLDQLWTGLKTLYPVSLTPEELVERGGGGLSIVYMIEELTRDALSAYEQREQELGTEVLHELERRVILSVLDRKWREHLYEMDYLQEGIGLRGYGQRDPVVEYQREAFDMFTAMMDGIKEESVGFLFNLDVQVPDETDEQPAGVDAGGAPIPAGDIGVLGEPVPSQAPAAFAAAPESQQAGHVGHEADDRQKVADVLGQVLGQPSRPASLQYSAPTVDGEGGVSRSAGSAPGNGFSAPGGEVSRNAPCPCGSGRKYKRCHGAPANR